jgi:hypothetical protein
MQQITTAMPAVRRFFAGSFFAIEHLRLFLIAELVRTRAC